METTWTGTGFMRVGTDSSLAFDITPVEVDADFNVIVRYEPQVRNIRRQSNEIYKTSRIIFFGFFSRHRIDTPTFV